MSHEDLYKPGESYTGGSEVEASACNAGDLGSIPGSGRPPGEGNGNPLQYSCLENPMDGGAWWATVHGVAESQTRLSNLTNFLHWALYLHTLNHTCWQPYSCVLSMWHYCLSSTKTRFLHERIHASLLYICHHVCQPSFWSFSYLSFIVFIVTG